VMAVQAAQQMPVVMAAQAAQQMLQVTAVTAVTAVVPMATAVQAVVLTVTAVQAVVAGTLMAAQHLEVTAAAHVTTTTLVKSNSNSISS
jgi:hypothetical protein